MRACVGKNRPTTLLCHDGCLMTRDCGAGYASLSHFFMKLAFAAPASGLPSLPTAFGAQASFVHFVMKLLSAAPVSALMVTVGTAVTSRPPQSGRIEARTGLRMMPTFPRSPLSFRTAGFPRYGWKAGLSGETFPNRPSA
jgi:hypothetical protein